MSVEERGRAGFVSERTCTGHVGGWESIGFGKVSVVGGVGVWLVGESELCEVWRGGGGGVGGGGGGGSRATTTQQERRMF